MGSTFEAELDARIGTVLRGKYRLDRILGAGGMAAVYAAEHRNGNRVAVKILHTSAAADRGVRERFLREGYAANAVQHPGAVRTLDDDLAEDGAAFLVMELLVGESLAERVDRRGGRLTVPSALTIAHRLLDVLAAAHDKQIVHRDIKPDNVFLTNEGEVKVLDFGIARCGTPLPKSLATRAGMLLGTPGFMAPEQVLGEQERVDARSDLWSVGATLYFCISGRFVHDGDTVERILVRTASERVRPILELVPDLHPAIAELVDKALAMDPAARHTDARAMRRAIDDAYSRAFRGSIASATIASGSAPISGVPELAATEIDPLRPVSDTLGKHATTRKSSRKPRLIAGAVAMVAALVVAGSAMLARDGRSARASIALPAAALSASPVLAASPRPPPSPTPIPASVPAAEVPAAKVEAPAAAPKVEPVVVAPPKKAAAPPSRAVTSPAPAKPSTSSPTPSESPDLFDHP